MTTYSNNVMKWERWLKRNVVKSNISKKEMKIVRLKGGPGSGHFNHRGRPGKQGGGLPDNVTLPKEFTQENFTAYVEAVKKIMNVNSDVALVDMIYDYNLLMSDSSAVVYGMYTPQFGRVAISKKAFAEDTKMESAGFGNLIMEGSLDLKVQMHSTADLGPKAILIHELAHAKDMEGRNSGSYVTDDEKFFDIWDQYQNSSLLADTDESKHKIISRYSVSNAQECYAEAVVAYVLDGEWLKNAQPKLHEFVGNSLKFGGANAELMSTLKEDEMVEIALSDGTYRWVKKTDISKKEMKVIRLKGGPGSGHRGHRGRPGKQGGGLPDDTIPEYSPDNWDFQRYLRTTAKFRNQVVKRIGDYYNSIGYSYDVDRLDTEFDMLLLDKARFDRYNEKWNLNLPEDMYQKLVDETKEIEREELRARIKYQDSKTVQDETGYVNFLASNGMRISETALFGNSLTDAKKELAKYPFYVDTGILSEDRAHRFLSNIIRSIDKYPEVKMLVTKGALSRITYDPNRKIGTATGSAAHKSIEIYDDEFGTSAGVFCHELGHVVLDFAYENNLITGNVSDIFGTGKRVSSYAWTNYDEDYAETFVAFISRNKRYLDDPDLESKMAYIRGNLRDMEDLDDKL